MAHIQSKYSGLWKPQSLTVDKISSQKMFIDNIDIIEDFAKVTMQKVHAPVQDIASLREINTSDTELFTTGMLIMVCDIGMFMFNRGISSVNGGNGMDGNAIIAPITGGGVWVPTTPSDIPLSPRGVSSATELDTMLTSILSNMMNNSVKYIIMNFSQIISPIGGGIIHMTIYKTNNTYAVVEARTYHTNPDVVFQFTRSRHSGIWGKWCRLPYLDENGRIPLDQLPSSIGTVIPASIE